MGKYNIGEFEEIVMLTVAILQEEAYGVAIKVDIESRVQRKVSVGALRTSLKRLEQKGLLKSAFGEATAVRGGKRKRYFTITPYGKTVLHEVRSTRNKLWDAIPSFELKLV